MKLFKKISKGIGFLFLAGVLLVAALLGYIVILHHLSFTLPSPTGTYHVGRTEYDWTDKNRIDPLADQPNVKRELPVWVWYPATVSSSDLPVPYLPSYWVNARNQDQGMGMYLERDLSAIQTHSFANVPVDQAQDKYPVIIMQPGMGPMATDYTVIAENLASHGYIVFGINQTYTSNVVAFPDGRVVLRSNNGTIPDSADAAQADADANRIEKVWAADVQFVMDQLQSLNNDSSSQFYNKLDLTHVGDFGHSFGGATALRICETDARCQAGADLDGTIFSDDLKGMIQKPFMFMTEDGCGKDCNTMQQVYSSATNTAYYLSVKGTKHFNFSDLPLRLSPPVRILFRQLGFIGPTQPERGLEITNAYLVAFFDESLKGVNSGLLQGPSSAYPEVQFEKR
ncbi:MAG TPA: hypothetical protein VMT73_00175 [Anaerolineales bacterium]|nr:hypothetical protein [Anaerolineales bacterium]